METELFLFGQVVIGLVTIAGMVLMSYYAVKILASMKHGVLERGWQFISMAAFCFVVGELALDLSLFIDYTPANSPVDAVLGFVGAAVLAAAGLVLALGFKMHYDAWNPKELSIAKSKAVEKKSVVENAK